MYAIVRSGGRQEKVAVGDLISLDRVGMKAGETVTLPALLLVDGDKITSDAKALSGVTVTAEVIEHTKGPKIEILRYKNKTGYRRRQGHRAKLTEVQVISIGDVKVSASDKLEAKTGKKIVAKKAAPVKAAPAVEAKAPDAEAPAVKKAAAKKAAPAKDAADKPAAKKAAPAKDAADKPAAKKATPAKKAAEKPAAEKTEK